MIFSGDRLYFDEGLAGIGGTIHFDQQPPLPELNFDASASNIVAMVLDVDLVEVQQGSEVSDVDIEAVIDLLESYSDYVDLLQLVPKKFRGSVLLQQLLYECGLSVGSWIGNTRDILALLNPNTVPDDYMQFLADIIGLDIIEYEDITTAERRRQLVQAIPWYKIKGTYQVLDFIQYIMGIHMEIKDMYTMDYTTFVPEDWFVGNVRMRTLTNASFEYWTAGIAVAPDDWTKTGAGSTIAQETVIKPDFALYSAKLTRVGTDCTLSQTIHEGKGIDYWQGKEITVGCWVRTSVSPRAYIYVGDGVGTTSSITHTGGGTWEYLTVTHTINVAATKVEIFLQVKNGNTSAYFTKVLAVEGNSFVETGVNPAGLDNRYYKSPHLGLQILLDIVYGDFPDEYLFEGSVYTKLQQYIERVRPINVVPRYIILLRPQTDETGTVITVDGDIRAKVIGSWVFSRMHFDEGFTFDVPGEFFDFSEDTFLQSIVKWKLGTGNKNGDLSLINTMAAPVLNGTIDSITLSPSEVVYEFTVGTAVVQSGISELGLYLADGTTLEVLALFPNIEKVQGMELKVQLTITR